MMTQQSMLKFDNARKFLAIQALRGYAALMVVYVHALTQYTERIDASFISSAIKFGLGALGVKLFFGISGFIIYTTSKNLLPGTASVKAFLLRRFIRVVPLYFILTTFYAIKLYVAGEPTSIENFLKSIFFIPYLTNSELMIRGPLLGQGWTLSYEILFYALFALCLFFVKGIRPLLISFILISLMLVNGFELIKYDPNDMLESSVYLLSGNYLMYFLFGLYIAVFYEKKKITSIFLTDNSKTLLFVISLVIYISVQVFFDVPTVIIEILTSIICVSTLYFAVVESPNDKRSSRSNYFENTIEMLGNASYSIYLTHGFVLGPAARVVAFSGLHMSPLLFTLLMFVLCSIVGIFVFKLLEEPLLIYLNKKYIPKPSLAN